MCKWVHAMFNFFHVNRQVEPLRIQVAQLNAELEVSRANLRQAKARLKQVTDKIEALQKGYQECIQKQQYLTDKINDCQVKLQRAEKLIGGLGGQQVRWIKEVQELGDKITRLPGDCALSAGMVAYTGAFTGSYRSTLEQLWRDKLLELNINHSEGVTMRATLGEPVSLQQWKVAGLPSDSLSIENGIIMQKARRWALMIDPQTQANNFIKKLGKQHDQGIEFCKASDGNIMRNLGTAIMNGKWFLIENVGQELDPSLQPVLLQQVMKQGAGFSIRLGDKNVEYNKNFRFFMTTTLPNPSYSPETCVKVTLLNFAITPDGLQEQMLGTVVAKESPQLEETKSSLIAQNARAQKDLKAIQDQILELISSSETNILESEELVDTLAASKVTSHNIMIKVQEAKKTEKNIDQARQSYRPVAFRASILFFCIVDLAHIDPMYQYSLQWFTKLFEMGIQNSPNPGTHDQRLQALNDYFTYSLYQNVCRSLFQKHKLLFSFILTMKILDGDNLMNLKEWRYLLTGPSGSVDTPQNPTNWMTDVTWQVMYQQIRGMQILEHFKGFEQFFMTNIDQFRPIFDASNAHQISLPNEWNQKLNGFQKLIVLKAIRADKMIPGIMNWIIDSVGRRFVIPPTFDLSLIYQDSTVTTPLICVLSAGSDPISAIVRFAEDKGMGKKLNSISLGQGQGPKAKKYIDDAKARGEWVLLQNCHLSASWMPSLERIVEEFDDSIHRDFRLWLTSNPSKDFPVSVLQNGVKMTIQPPNGLRSNLLLSYSSVDDRDLDDCKKPNEYKSLYFAFCFFHAIVQDRRKFGPIGWNISYEFTNQDLGVTLKQLKLFLDQDSQTIPFKVLNILGADVNYGGRVTDDKDSILINTILRNYINPDLFQSDYKFSSSGKYFCPPPGRKDTYVSYIESLDLNPEPEAFGLHDNAQISTAQMETLNTLETILLMQPRSTASGGKSRQEIIGEIAKGIQDNLPASFAIDEVSSQYPTSYNQSMNTVLFQEVIKYQRLLDRMTSTLADVQKALVGRIVMSEQLEKVANSLFDNQVPETWADVGFLSMKPLSSWFKDLTDRINFLVEWIANGTPKYFWISGFFFPQAFFTGTLQNYARKHVIPIDKLSFEFHVLDNLTLEEISEKPQDGCYVHGLWLEGARWDEVEHCVGWSKPKELYVQMPIVHFLPVPNRVPPTDGVYNCPVYKVISRRGTLSTTGHSTNFVLFLELVSKEPADKWIRAGVAMFLALRT